MLDLLFRFNYPTLQPDGDGLPIDTLGRSCGEVQDFSVMVLNMQLVLQNCVSVPSYAEL